MELFAHFLSDPFILLCCKFVAFWSGVHARYLHLRVYTPMVSITAQCCNAAHRYNATYCCPLHTYHIVHPSLPPVPPILLPPSNHNVVSHFPDSRVLFSHCVVSSLCSVLFLTLYACVLYAVSWACYIYLPLSFTLYILDHIN